MQGFKHEGAVSQALDKQSPTMSRLARHLLLVVASCQRWRCFKADVADAFLQGVDLHDVGVTIGVPNADMRRRLARLMDLRPDEDIRMLKSGFGDVRAPKLWYDAACATLTDLGCVTHPLAP